MPEATPTSDSLPGSSPAAPRLVLGAFEGPLDLLLHLIRVNEIEITDIPIVEVCRQYDAYLSLMREMNLQFAGEYLVMAATLTHIKSRMLLPPDPVAPGEAPPDPRDELVRQLLDYERMKAAAEALREKDERQADAFPPGHPGGSLPDFSDEALLEVSLFDLLSAFRRLIDSLSDAAPLHVPRDEISVAEKISWMLDRLEGSPGVRFQDLIGELHGRGERIAAFLALLELIRLRLIRAEQRHTMGDIMIVRDISGDADDSSGGGADAGN